MDTVSSYFGIKAPAKTYGRRTNAGLLVGIEIELENVTLLNDVDGWKKIKDGSLKVKGLEFTLPVWHPYAYSYLKNLFDNLHKPDASSRCSVHIHCNILNFNVEQLRSLVLLYTIFERPLYRFSGKRWNSNYCVPFQTWGIGVDLNKLNISQFCNTFPKYSGINIVPDDGRGVYIGTIEFRQMAGNKNPRYINTWINILTKLVKYAEKQSFDELKQRINLMRINSQYWELTTEIFQEYADAINYSTFDEDVEKGITFAKLVSVGE
jgi:hypothetical protein